MRLLQVEQDTGERPVTQVSLFMRPLIVENRIPQSCLTHSCSCKQPVGSPRRQDLIKCFCKPKLSALTCISHVHIKLRVISLISEGAQCILRIMALSVCTQT